MSDRTSSDSLGRKQKDDAASSMSGGCPTRSYQFVLIQNGIPNVEAAFIDRGGFQEHSVKNERLQSGRLDG